MTTSTHGNAKKLAQLEKALAEVLAAALRRDFYGTVAVEATVQDGTIQSIRRKIEQVEK